jgi:Family of unknown function (DUF6223)
LKYFFCADLYRQKLKQITKMKSQKKINVKRAFTYILVGLVAIALYFGLVHLVLMAANVSKSAPTTVYGLTSRRQWALVILGVALVSVIFGWRILRQAVKRSNILKGKITAVVVIALGLLAVISGGLSLTSANGGPGSGNGVLGSAQALVLGLIGMVLGGLAMARFKRENLNS